MIEILFLYLFLIFFMSLKLSSQGNERTVSGLFTTDDGKRIQHERRTMFLHYSEDSLRARRGLVRGTGTLHQARKDGWVRPEKMFYFLICYSWHRHLAPGKKRWLGSPPGKDVLFFLFPKAPRKGPSKELVQY